MSFMRNEYPSSKEVPAFSELFVVDSNLCSYPRIARNSPHNVFIVFGITLCCTSKQALLRAGTSSE